MRRFKEFHVWIPSTSQLYRTISSEDAAKYARQFQRFVNKRCVLFAVSEGNTGYRRHNVHIASSIKETRRLAAKAKRMCAIENTEGD